MNHQIALMHDLIPPHCDMPDLLLDVFDVACAVGRLELLRKVLDAEKTEGVLDFSVALKWSFVEKLLDLFPNDVGRPRFLSIL